MAGGRRAVGPCARRGPVAARPRVEHGSAHRHVVGGGGDARDPVAAGGGEAAGVVAAGRSAVPRGDEDGNALSRGLGPELVEEGGFRRAHQGFAVAEARSQHRDEVVVHQVERGEVGPVGGAGGRRDHEEDVRARGRRGGPLGVDVGFELLVQVQDAGIRAVVDLPQGAHRPLGIGVGAEEVALESGVVGGGDVGPAHHPDGDAGPVGACVEEGVQAVDGGEVPGAQEAVALAVGRLRLVRLAGLQTSERVVGHVPAEVVEGGHSAHEVGEPPGDRDGGGVALVRGPVDLVLHDGGPEGVAHLGGGSRKGEGQPAAGDAFHPEALLLQPEGRRLQLGPGGPELPGEAFRGQPLVVAGRARVLLVLQELGETRGGVRSHLQDQQHPLHGGVGGHGAQGFSPGQPGMDAAGQDHPGLVVPGDSGPRGTRHRLGRQGGGDEACA